MDELTRGYIEKVACCIRNYYDIKTPITDMQKIVAILGGSVEEIYDFDNYYDGSIQKSGKDSFCIKVSPFVNKQRRNFTIAHELGHLFLHMGFRTNSEVWKHQEECIYRRFGSSEQEYQANEFAAAFLMPKDEYISYVDEIAEDNIIDMEAVARRFNVSLSAAVNRGRFLRIIA